jgi:hypothetical protein
VGASHGEGRVGLNDTMAGHHSKIGACHGVVEGDVVSVGWQTRWWSQGRVELNRSDLSMLD